MSERDDADAAALRGNRHLPTKMVEEHLLGIGALSATAFVAARLIVQPDDIEDPILRRLWIVFGEEVDRVGRVTVSAVRARFAADPEYGTTVGQYIAELVGLGELSLIGADPADVGEEIAKQVRDFSLRRRLRSIANDLLRDVDAVDVSADELATDAAAAISDSAASGRDTAMTRARVIERVVEQLQQPLRCWSTGMPQLDKAMGGGLFGSKFYSFQGRYKQGKSALLSTLALNLHHHRVPVLLITNEMNPEEIEHRNLGRELETNPIAFLHVEQRSRLVTKIAALLGTSSSGGLVYERAAGATYDDARAMIARARARHGIVGVIWDYLQRVKGQQKGETEEQHLRKVVDGIADTCKRTGMWSVIGAQENKEGNTRGGEGLRMAVDQHYVIHKDPDTNKAWLECTDSRYMAGQDVGSEDVPAFWLNPNGVWFEDLSLPIGSLGLQRGGAA